MLPKTAVVPRDDLQIDRYEYKYLVAPEQVPAIRRFIRSFVRADAHAEGEVPEYIVTTLQLDALNGALHYAKERKARSRFKLRIRTYGTDGKAPYFMEIKRKVNVMILKSRATLQCEDYTRENLLSPTTLIPFANEAETMNYLEFVRLVREIGARPFVYVRYVRESYKGASERYARVTIDRRLRYRPARGSWEFPLQAKRWYSMDTQTALRREYPGHVLELKAEAEFPEWMAELVERFDLVNTGFCKYSAAMRLESLFRGSFYSDASENCSYEDGSDF
ncbi:MAG: polyphosphate polymerase domain-containing protein [Opitutales bacterium]